MLLQFGIATTVGVVCWTHEPVLDKTKLSLHWIQVFYIWTFANLQLAGNLRQIPLKFT